MSKDGEIIVEGIVKEACRGGSFICELENGNSVMAYPAGKMRKFSIRIVPGDIVRLALSPYDLSKGRITFREK